MGTDSSRANEHLALREYFQNCIPKCRPYRLHSAIVQLAHLGSELKFCFVSCGAYRLQCKFALKEEASAHTAAPYLRPPSEETGEKSVIANNILQVLFLTARVLSVIAQPH